MVVKNMPGADGRALPRQHRGKDGTALNTFHFGDLGEDRLAPATTRINFRKFNWIGNISQDLTSAIWHGLGVNAR